MSDECLECTLGLLCPVLHKQDDEWPVMVLFVSVDPVIPLKYVRLPRVRAQSWAWRHELYLKVLMSRSIDAAMALSAHHPDLMFLALHHPGHSTVNTRVRNAWGVVVHGDVLITAMDIESGEDVSFPNSTRRQLEQWQFITI